MPFDSESDPAFVWFQPASEGVLAGGEMVSKETTKFPTKRADVRIAICRLSCGAIAIRAVPIQVDAQGLAMLPLKTAERDGVRTHCNSQF